MDRPERTSVLIVEDERIVARDIQQTLAGLGYDAYAIAASGDEAIAAAARRCPDVVLMDIRIEGKRDGVETAAVLRDRFDVPVVFVTAHADDATIGRAKVTEPFGYLVKPLRPGELRSAIEVALHRHAMERRLRQRERWFATTLGSIADAVLAVDLAANVTFMNAPAEALTGVTAAAAQGRPVGEILRLLDAQRAPATETPLEAALREGRTVELVDGAVRNVTSGAVRTIEDSAALVVDVGQVVGAVMVFRDVTEHRRLRAQLELADRLVSLGTLAAGVAHEVNNPLAVVITTSDCIAERLADHRAELARAGVDLGPASQRRLDDLAEELADLRFAARRIDKIVQDLRHFGRSPPEQPGPVQVPSAVQWAVRMTALEVGRRARLVTDLQPVPVIHGDDTRLGQVLVNLLVNAAQAIAPGDPSANEVRVATRTDAQGRAVIEVSDTGAGIPEELTRRVFEPFFTTKPAGVGTGLGLSICHGIVTAMGGQIEAARRAGGGTVMRVVLPPAATPAPAASPEPQPAARARVLLVVEDAMMARLLQRGIDVHDVVVCTRAAAALELLAQGDRFDAVVSDLSLPGMAGPEFYEQLLRRFPDVAPSVIFLGGAVDSPRERAFLDTVPNERLDRPFAMASLLGAVERAIAAGRRGGAT